MESPTLGQDRLWMWMAFVVLVAAVILAEPLLSAKPLFLRDLGLWHYPVLYAARGADSPEVTFLPLWTSALGTGRPMLANPAYALLHPANILYLIFSFNRAFNLYLALHVMVAGLGMLLLARRLGLSAAAASVAAVAYMLGGHVMSCTAQYPMMAPVAWAPWVLMAGLGAALDPRPARVAVLACMIAIQLLGGQPEPTLMTLAVGFAWSAALPGQRHRLRGVAVWAAGGLWGAALAAPQILPAISFARDSVRGLGLSGSIALYWSLHPRRVLELITPPAHGWLEIGWPPQQLIDGGKPLFNSHYIGLSVAILAVAGLAAAWPGKRRTSVSAAVIFATAVTGLVFSFGRYLPGVEIVVGRLGHALPFRFPVKMVFIPALAVPLLAGLGVMVVADSVRPRLRRFVVLAAIAVVVGDLGWAHRLLAPVASVAPRDLERPLIGALEAASRELGAPRGQWRIYFYRLPRGGWGPRLVKGEVIDADLFFTWQQRMVVPRTGLVSSLQYAFEPSVEILDTRAYFALTSAVHQSDPAVLARALGAVGVLWVVSPKPDLEARSAGQLIWVATLGEGEGVPPGSGWIYRVSSYTPRIRLTTSFVVYPQTTAGDMIDRFSRGGDQMPVVLDEDPGVIPDDDPASVGLVERVVESNRGLTVDVSCNRPAILVVADLLAPGWTVRVDGRQAEIIRADLAFRAVALPEGAHRVEFRYVPPEFSTGLIIAIMAGLAVCFCCWPGVRGRLRSFSGRKSGRG